VFFKRRLPFISMLLPAMMLLLNVADPVKVEVPVTVKPPNVKA